MNMNNQNNPVEFVLFGASGDLSREKIYPALFNIFDPEKPFAYLGYSRTLFDNDEFQNIVRDSVIKKYPHANPQKLTQFINRFRYVSGSYDAAGIAQLKHTQKNVFRYYYLAIPSDLALIENIVDGLDQNHLTKKSIIVLEKPFGFDYASASELNNYLLRFFPEEMIYRIDHYLAKDLVQDILALRFANPIFVPIWNNRYIQDITINIMEKEGIRNRGQYYENSGVIKDMIQNHALQLLALTLMDTPKSLSSADIDLAKANIFKKIKLFEHEKNVPIKIGQYDRYRREKFVDSKSLVETFVSIVLEVDNKNWRGVPIHIVSGKKMPKRTTDIIVNFKKFKHCLWNKDQCKITNNQIRINIQPDNDIHLRLNSEFDPASRCAIPTTLRFGYEDNEFILKDSYENALQDLFRQDRLTCTNSNEILLAWKFVDKIIKLLDKKREEKLIIYNAENIAKMLEK
jgi:glucose-6-phosphate 1-dehydrogenase